MADNRRAESAPNIYPLGHPSRATGGRVQNKPTPQPARSRPTILQTAPSAPAAVPTAPVETTPVATGEQNLDAVTGTTDARTTEV